MGESDNGFTYKDSVTLREYLESRLEAVEKATYLAANTLEKRLEGMNEFREALKSQTNLFVTRTEIENQFGKLGDDIRELRESKAMLEGKASQLYVTITFVISLISLFIASVAVFSALK